MNTDISIAKAILSQENCTCVLWKGEKIFRSNRRGVAPLLEFLNSGEDFQGFSAADKVVGKATAFLYCLLGIKTLYARVLSAPAMQVLQQYEISFSYDYLVEGIRNRENTGPCPMEKATRDAKTPEDALAAIIQTLKNLQS